MRFRDSLPAATYFCATLVSAFLLFQVQPIISKAILPWFGGSPAVWTTCMLFFQTVLFAGYLYAHILENHLPRKVAPFVHLLLVVAALFMLPIMPSDEWKPTENAAPATQILMLLAATVGLPYFLLSSTGPLLQAWFGRTYPGRSPYRLYALSNAGSLAALISYPFLVEPRFDIPQQSLLWTLGFWLFAVLIVGGVAAVWRSSVSSPQEPALDDGAPNTAPGLIIAWIALPAFASLTLLATTNQLCQNVAVIPFLWVLPLAVYLLTFIICFDHERWYQRWITGAFTLLAVLGCWGTLINPFGLSFTQEIILHLAMMFGVCMICHGELVRLRPPTALLTRYYLSISAGGAIGGLFVSIVAPLIFQSFFEWRIALMGGFVLSAICVTRLRLPGESVSVLAFCWRVGAILFGLFVLLLLREPDSERIVRVRNFYGEVSVARTQPDEEGQTSLFLYSGGIIHGVQFESEAMSKSPTTYFAPVSGMGRVLRSRFAERPLNVAIVGLGCGTLASYSRAGDRYRFFEINPAMVSIARGYFTFLKDAEGEIEVVLGDARVSLERDKGEPYDVLILDAFAGDAVPAHLLTREAFEVYRRRLKPDGAICVHIQNKYLDLAPVIRAAASEQGLQRIRIVGRRDLSRHIYTSISMILSNNPLLLNELREFDAEPAGDARTILWTDKSSNLFEILK